MERCTGVAYPYSALGFGIGRSALFERECRFWKPGFYLKLRPYMKPHAGLAPTFTQCVALVCLLRTGQQLCGIYATTVSRSRIVA